MEVSKLEYDFDFELLGKIFMTLVTMILSLVAFGGSNGLAKSSLWSTASKSIVETMSPLQRKEYEKDLIEAKEVSNFWYMFSYYGGRGTALGVFMATKSLIIFVFEYLSSLFIN